MFCERDLLEIRAALMTQDSEILTGWGLLTLPLGEEEDSEGLGASPLPGDGLLSGTATGKFLYVPVSNPS